MKFLLTICLSALLGLCTFAQASTDSTQVESDSIQVSESVLDSVQISSEDSLKVVNAVMESLQINPTDSTQISNQLKSAGEKQVQENLGTSVPKDSTELANEAERQAIQKLKQESGLNVNGMPKDSSAVANEAERQAIKKLNEESGFNVSGIPKDSAAVTSEVKNLGKAKLSEEIGMDVPDIKMDSTAKDQVKDEAVKQAESALKNTDEFQSLGGEDDVLGGLSPEQLQQMKAKKEMKQKMAGHAKSFITEHSDQIQEVQEQMSELKQKYSEVPDSKDLSTATKRSSLKGESFWKRLVLGGNFNVSATDPVTLDLSPVVGWRFNKLFQAGVTGVYRTQFGSASTSNNPVEDNAVYGYSVFANHAVFRNFFGYLEGENMSRMTGTAEDSKREWQQTLLLGIGRKFKIAPFLEMQAIIAFNFLHENKDGVYNNPVVFKTGFRILK